MFSLTVRGLRVGIEIRSSNVPQLRDAPGNLLGFSTAKHKTHCKTATAEQLRLVDMEP